MNKEHKPAARSNLSGSGLIRDILRVLRVVLCGAFINLLCVSLFHVEGVHIYHLIRPAPNVLHYYLPLTLAFLILAVCRQLNLMPKQIQGSRNKFLIFSAFFIYFMTVFAGNDKEILDEHLKTKTRVENISDFERVPLVSYYAIRRIQMDTTNICVSYTDSAIKDNVRYGIKFCVPLKVPGETQDRLRSRSLWLAETFDTLLEKKSGLDSSKNIGVEKLISAFQKRFLALESNTTGQILYQADEDAQAFIRYEYTLRRNPNYALFNKPFLLEVMKKKPNDINDSEKTFIAYILSWPHRIQGYVFNSIFICCFTMMLCMPLLFRYNFLSARLRRTYHKFDLLLSLQTSIRRHPAIWGLLCIQVSYFLVTRLLYGNPKLQTFIADKSGGLSLDLLNEGQWWRMLTFSFVFLSSDDILIITLLSTLIIGLPVEEQLGFWKTLTLYFLSVVFEVVICLIITPSGIITGSSGIIALFIAFCFLCLWPGKNINRSRGYKALVISYFSFTYLTHLSKNEFGNSSMWDLILSIGLVGLISSEFIHIWRESATNPMNDKTPEPNPQAWSGPILPVLWIDPNPFRSNKPDED